SGDAAIREDLRRAGLDDADDQSNVLFRSDVFTGQAVDVASVLVGRQSVLIDREVSQGIEGGFALGHRPQTEDARSQESPGDKRQGSTGDGSPEEGLPAGGGCG